MADNSSETGTATRVNLGEQLTVGTVVEVRERLLGHLESSGDLVLDLSMLREVDVTGLQLLCAAHRSAVARGVRLTAEGNGEVLADALRVSGLTGTRGERNGFPRNEKSPDG